MPVKNITSSGQENPSDQNTAEISDATKFVDREIYSVDERVIERKGEDEKKRNSTEVRLRASLQEVSSKIRNRVIANAGNVTFRRKLNFASVPYHRLPC